jgi:hypothetical protein
MIKRLVLLWRHQAFDHQRGFVPCVTLGGLGGTEGDQKRESFGIAG